MAGNGSTKNSSAAVTLKRRAADQIECNDTLPTEKLSPLSVWALAFGCCIGWGSFMMPGTMFLPNAGVAGTTIALTIGAAVMILIAYNYHFVMQRHAAGGVFSFTRKIFGEDHAFFCAWFLWIAYASLLWANATAVTLMGRNLAGNALKVGFHYKFQGFDVYGGEVFFTIFLFALFGTIFARKISLAMLFQRVAAVGLLLGVIFCFVSASSASPVPINFSFVDNVSPWKQIFIIVALVPWAFVGFETISQYTIEIKTGVKKSFALMSAAIICAAVVYILMTTLATLNFPAPFSSSEVYVKNLDKFSGLEHVPTFFVITKTFGGIFVLTTVVLCALVTSMIGYYRAVENLTSVLATEKVLPSFFVSRQNATLFIFAVSVIAPFFGRTVISWLTDVTTIGATIAYGYTSACAFVLARREKNFRVKICGAVGVGCAIAFSFFLLIPNLWTIDVLTMESYFILAIWGLAGFAYFTLILRRDTENRFGKSTTVWLVMFFLVFFSGLMWMREKMFDDLRVFIAETTKFFSLNPHAPTFAYANAQSTRMSEVLLGNSMILFFVSLAGLIFLFRIYSLIQRREVAELEREKLKAEESSRAKTTFLSNMSHDIRTPMNAIIGYTNLARRNETSPEELRDFLRKIDASSQHLLALINDVLEMSRIESGRMELEPVPTNLATLINDVHDMFATQMATKKISFTVDSSAVRDKYVLCDANRLNRVLLNLLSNAYKFTPEDGKISVTLSQREKISDDTATYQLRVKDSGIGMSPEFAAKVFDAFERERTSTVSKIQGTGLGMAITKSIVDLMGGNIRVDTERGRGTEFIVDFRLNLCENVPAEILDDVSDEISAQVDVPPKVNFDGKKILLVDDIEVNREISKMILEDAGFVVDTAENGKIAVEKVSASKVGDYDLILMDIQMPVMDGYVATEKIRELDDENLANIPIIAMTANAFSEDVKAAHDAGMNAHIAKPLDVPKMLETLRKILPA